MSRRLTRLMLALLVVTGCGSTPTPTPTPTPTSAATASAAADLLELPVGGRLLVAGRYQRPGFVPSITFAVDDGWTTGTVSDGFFDVQQEPGTADVMAVQFARVLGVVGADGTKVTPRTAADAAAAIEANPALTVVETSPSRLGGLDGLNLVVANEGTRTAPVLEVSLGSLGFDPGRRLWIALFDTDQGLLAVLVGGSTARWDETLRTAEPVLESVVIGRP
jgi:hypothetical protein